MSDWRVRVKWRLLWEVMHQLAYKQLSYEQAISRLETLGVPPLSAWIMATETKRNGYSPHRDWP